MNLLARLRQAASTTPGLYRVASVALGTLLVLTAVVGTVAANGSEASTGRLRDNTAPVLVSTQTLLASLAEADAAATAAFLSGSDEDREQRRLYEEALARATSQSEEISALIGDDAAAHERLKRLGVRVTRYAGLIEAARATQQSGATGSEEYLLRALDEVTAAVGEDAAALTRLSEDRFDDDAETGSPALVAAAISGLLALGGVLAVSVVVARRSRRLINPLLLVAAVAITASSGWLVWTWNRTAADIEVAQKDAYESIALTAQIQVAAFGGRGDESVALISGDDGRRVDADRAASLLASVPIDAPTVETVRDGAAPGFEGFLFDAAVEADSPRERAAVAEMMVRWQRYDVSVDQLRSSGEEQARAIAVGPASAAFNGFNFSVESVLADNRAQFLGAIEDADDRTAWLSTITLVLPLLAAIAMLAGLQVRINEYR